MLPAAQPVSPCAAQGGRQRFELCTAVIKSATLSRYQRIQFLKTEVFMPRFLVVLALVCCVGSLSMRSQDHKASAPEDYLFVWTGDAAHQGNDFLAVIDADPASASYGRLVTALATDQQTKQVHHTEYTMPASGMVFANDHGAGRTFIFDLRDPLHPKTASSFTDMAG